MKFPYNCQERGINVPGGLPGGGGDCPGGSCPGGNCPGGGYWPGGNWPDTAGYTIQYNTIQYNTIQYWKLLYIAPVSSRSQVQGASSQNPSNRKLTSRGKPYSSSRDREINWLRRIRLANHAASYCSCQEQRRYRWAVQAFGIFDADRLSAWGRGGRNCLMISLWGVFTYEYLSTSLLCETIGLRVWYIHTRTCMHCQLHVLRTSKTAIMTVMLAEI